MITKFLVVTNLLLVIHKSGATGYVASPVITPLSHLYHISITYMSLYDHIVFGIL